MSDIDHWSRIERSANWVPSRELHLPTIVQDVCRALLDLREAKAEAWDEAFEAGHEAARAVNAEYPDAPVNPYRKEPPVDPMSRPATATTHPTRHVAQDAADAHQCDPERAEAGL